MGRGNSWREEDSMGGGGVLMGGIPPSTENPVNTHEVKQISKEK